MDVSTRLLTLVGAALTDLHGRDLHDALPWWQAATESPQLVAGRWLSAEPLTMSKHLVVWVLVDRTAEVQLAALNVLKQLQDRPRTFVVDGHLDAKFLGALVNQQDPTIDGRLSVENIAGACIRLLSLKRQT